MDSEGWDERYSARDYVWSVEPNQFVAEYLADLPPGDAIDLGAGEGRNAVWLATRGWRVTAVDFSDVALEKGAALARNHDVDVDFVHHDATTYDPSEPVDLVVLSYLQLEPPGRELVLEHASRWLRPGGTLFVIAHDKANISDGHGGPSSPDVCYSVEDTLAAIDPLVATTATIAERTVDTDDGPRVALDTLVVATAPAESAPR
ncbi:MAG: class I SAM-dependent methyltransferase [Acidimicrobiia bacterium]|nr:class I SAM-dependent methyltransferase [Acidimicrobiia bacterium]